MQDEKLEHLGLHLADAATSQYYFFREPRFDYQEDFLLDPRQERVRDQASFEFLLILSLGWSNSKPI
jgi:hypothetical protein